MGLQRTNVGPRHAEWWIVFSDTEHGRMYYLIRAGGCWSAIRWFVPDGPLIAQLKREGVTA